MTSCININNKTELIFRTALFLIVWLSVFVLSGTLSLNSVPQDYILDASSELALEHFSSNHFQFGKDIIFTFGPFGYLYSYFSQGLLIEYRIVFAVIWCTVVSFSIINIFNRIGGMSKYIFLFWVVMTYSYFGLFEQHALMVFICFCGLLLSDNSLRVSYFIIYPAAITFISLIKFSMFIAALLVLMVILFGLVIQKELTRAVIVLTAFILYFVVFWLAAGQNLANLPEWLVSSFQIVSGYSDATYLKPLTSELLLSIIAAIIYLYTACLILKEPETDKSKRIYIIFVTLCVFISWKHGLNRAIGHITSYAIFLPIAIASLMAFTVDTKIPRRTSRQFPLLFVAVSVLCILISEQRQTGWTWNHILKWPEHIASNTKCVYYLVTGNWSECFETLKPDYSLKGKPELNVARSVIANSAVDLIGFQQWALLVNGFNYHPRPIYQGYSVFNEYLQQRNLSYFQKNTRPEFLVLKVETIDYRHQMMDDATVMPYILSNYDLVSKDGDFLILKQRPIPLYANKPKLIKTQIIGFDETVYLYGSPDKILLLKVDINQTLFGKFVKLLYQPLDIQMRIISKGQQLYFNFIPSMARQGFVVNPVVIDNSGLENLYRGKGRTAYAFTFDRPIPSFWQVSEKIKIEIYELESAPAAIES